MIATAVSPELSELTTQQAKAYFTTHPDIVGQDDGTRAYEVAIVQLIDKNKWTYEVIKPVLTPLIDLYATEPDLAYALGKNLNQNQFDALVSFTFNCGAGNLRKLVNGGQRTIAEISKQGTTMSF